jgi:hypothetical protein
MALDNINLIWFTMHGIVLPDLFRYLDAVKSAGLRAMVEIPSVGINAADPVQLKQFLQLLKDRPEIWAWFLYDEPETHPEISAETITTAYNIVKAEDPTRPIVVNFTANGRPPSVIPNAANYPNAMDDYMLDYYPIYKCPLFGGRDVPSFFTYLKQYRSLLPDKPFWAVLQAFEGPVTEEAGK